MAAAVTLSSAEVKVGTQVTVTGTGFANSTACTCTFANPEETESEVIKATSSGAGAVDFGPDGSFTPEVDGLWTITVTDGTSTVVKTLKVNS